MHLHDKNVQILVCVKKNKVTMFNCDYSEHLCIKNTEPCHLKYICIYQDLKHFSKSI